MMKKIYSLLSAITLFAITNSSVLFAQTWTTIDGGGTYSISSTTSSNSNYPSVAVFNGGLYAIWQENIGSAYEVHVKKYDGSSWTTAGNSAGSSLLYSCTYSLEYPKLVYYNNALYAAWSGFDAGIYVVHVKKYDGSSWSFTENYSVGDGRTNIHYGVTANAKKINLCVFNNELYATWVEEANITGIQQVRVSKFNGSLWSSIDGNSTNGINFNTAYTAYDPTLCVFNNALYAAWTESNSSSISQLRVRRYDGGSTWTFIDGNGADGINYSTSTGIYDAPLSLSSFNGKMYVFWTENNRIRVKRYDATNGWTTDIDGGSGWNHNAAVGAYYPNSIVYNNLLYATWEQNPVPRQVRVVSFDGTTKTFIDGNVAGVGINNTTTNRGHFPKQINYQGNLIAVWSEELTSTSGSANQIRAKKYPLPPFVESVSVPANATYSATQTLDFTVTFSKIVNVSGGTPYIPITLNTGGTVNATYASGSGTTALVFRYTVASGNADNDGVTVGSSITLPGGCTLRSSDSSPLDANLTLNSVGTTTGVFVDGIAPSVSSINRYDPSGSSTTAASIIYRVSFNENVSNVDFGDFSLTTTGTVNGTIASVSASSGTTIDVTINSISGNGTLRLDLKGTDTGITDNAGNSIGGGFTTGQTYTIVKVPQVTTQAVSGIGSTNATGNGNITDLGYPNPTAYGVCWNTTGTPTTSDSKVDNGTASATGSFTATMSSLTASALYYVRAYATNSAGTSYGAEVTFTTLTPNNAPTNIALSGSAINENVVANSTVGTLSTTDPDAGNSFTYSLETGTGSTDNASFTISGDKLNINASPNFEVKSSYSVRVRTTDQGTLFFDKVFTITINDVNEAPTNIALSGSAINENVVANSTVGTLSTTDPDAGNTFTYSLETGAGSTDNASFTISGDKLNINASPNFEVKSSYSVRVRTTDQGTLFFDKVFTITINDLNDVTPIITASQEFHVAEQSLNGTTVGTVLATDGDVTLTTFQNWTITTGNSNGYFAINSLSGVITVADNTGLNPNINQSFTLTLTVSDGINTSLAQTVSIVVTAVNDENPVITASQSFAINENSANGSTIGTVLATDPDYGTVFQGWAITAGNTSNTFAINSTTGVISVNTSTALDYEIAHSFLLTIQVSDGLHNASGVVTININNLNDNAPVVNDANFAIDENSANATLVGTVTASDADGSLNSLNYSITSGNTNGAFAINSSTGAITVNKMGEMNFEVTPIFNLVVNVSDGIHSNDANVRISLNDLVETGITDEVELSVNVYPNPAVYSVNISLSNTTISSYTIEIINTNGAKKYQSEPINSSKTKNIDLKGFSKGIYIIKIYNQNSKFIKKLVVE